jgi:hypothetical protein
MPVKIDMFIPSGKKDFRQPALKDKTLNPVLPTANLTSSMISRVHTAKPGCSSCGRH